MRVTERVGPAFFDDLYAADPDPWDFETSPYEAAKYDATIAALEGRRFASGLEIGCSIGVLTDRLRAHCDDAAGDRRRRGARWTERTRAASRTSPSSAARCRRSSPTARTT